MNRRKMVALTAGLLASTSWVATASAQADQSQKEFPNQPVTLVVPYAAGGATDVIARLIGQGLNETWKQPVVVSNRAGAGTTLGAGHVAKAAGNGYTLYMTTAAHTISSSLYKSLPYDPIKDFAPINLAAVIPVVLVSGPSLQVTDLNDLLKQMRAKPGMSVGSPGNGSPQHLTSALFKTRAKVDINHVPYRGDAPMLNDLIGGQVDCAFVTLSAALPYLKSGKIKAVALAHSRRSPAAPEVPTFAEAGFGQFEAATWFGLFGPSSMPAALQDKIYKDASAVVRRPEMTAKLLDMGADVVNLGPKDFADFMQAEVRNWAEAVRLSGAQVD